ncbi:hypothetical protein GYMLUDRAFT_75718 [Collybiopsis luxurians FD-317 M1]|uniref:Uncharacterized protein n=1 Tax=Collybiopsis luxurians FD-317 M1 TaxID=944289 RepID=A0A0D0B1Z0_9AGAR|nr:hypothetical protein GYMLUDRAFT_75718 [Collybiopsis luxurians FD-317 M1]
MDYDTPFCPVCDKQIAPKRTTQVVTENRPLPASARQRNLAQNRPVTKTKTIIDQGPFPLYCSDECKMADMLNPRQDSYSPPTYYIYPSTKSEHTEVSSSLSDVESESLCSMSTTDASYPSPTSEHPPNMSASTPITCQPKQRSRSFLSGRESRSSGPRHAAASLPTTSTFLNAYESSPSSDANLLSAFQGSFSRRCESRVSMYSGPPSPTSRSPPSVSALSTSPRRERPLLAQGAEGKLLVPDLLVRRPTASRRESSSSLASMASIASAPGAMTMRNRTGSMASVSSSRASATSPLARYGSDFGDEDRYDLSEEDESACEDSDAPFSPGLGSFGYPAPQRPLLGDMRAWSFDAAGSAFSTIREPRREKTQKKEKRQSYNPDGKKLFLFPTD